MNENTEGPHRRERHKRGRGRDGRRGGQGPAQGDRSREQTPGRDASVRENPRGGRPEERRPASIKIDLPPLPKLPTPTCSKCGEPIQDITSALADRDTGAAMHFDCVIKFLEGAENLGANEKIVYIGQGRFAVMFFENPVDTRKFKIIRVIEWENRETESPWREDISSQFSQVR